MEVAVAQYMPDYTNKQLSNKKQPTIKYQGHNRLNILSATSTLGEMHQAPRRRILKQQIEVSNLIHIILHLVVD